MSKSLQEDFKSILKNQSMISSQGILETCEDLVKEDLSDNIYEYSHGYRSISPIIEPITEDTRYVKYADECNIKLPGNNFS